MTNSISGAYKIVQPNRTQAYLRSQLVADVIAKAEFGTVAPAQEIRFPYGNSVKVQTYGYQSGNGRTDQTLVKDSYQIDQVKTAIMGYDRIQNLQVQNPSWVSDIENEMAYQLARNVDQTVINKGVTSAYTSITAGAITASGLLALMANTAARLFESQRLPGELVWVMDPLRAALLPQMNAQSGFVKADNALEVGFNGFEGQEACGFKVLVSNNLLYSVPLNLPVNPSNGDTLTVGNFIATFVTNGTAANPNDISIGGSAATTQTLVKDWMNDTVVGGAQGASTYIDATAEDRIDMQNSQLTCGSFTSNTATVTKYGRIGGTTSTSGNSFGVETSNMFAGVQGSIDMTMLQTPYFEELPANAGTNNVTHAKDMIMTTLWGSGVWHRKKRSMAAISFNA